MRITIIALILSIILSVQTVFAQQRDLQFYQTLAHLNNSAIKANNNHQVYNTLQNNLTLIQYRKPQILITTDFLFAPFFLNNGQFISITQSPEINAFGYDVGISNGGLYSTQLNASLPLLNGTVINTYQKQLQIQNQILQNDNKVLLHDLDKNISDQYVFIYRLQQQKIYQQKVVAMVKDRIKIAEALVLKGLLQQSDYLLLEIELKQRQFDELQIKLNLSTIFIQLNNFCGISDTTMVEVIAPNIVQSPPSQQQNYKFKFELDSTTILSQEKVFNTKYKPQLVVFGNTGINATAAENIPHNFGISAGLHLVIPLYDGGQKKIFTQQNKLLSNNLQLYRDQNSISVMNNLALLQQQITITQQSIAIINLQLSSQQTLLNILEDKVVNGQISVTDYLNAFRDYASSHQNIIEVQSNLLLLINQYNYISW